MISSSVEPVSLSITRSFKRVLDKKLRHSPKNPQESSFLRQLSEHTELHVFTAHIILILLATTCSVWLGRSGLHLLIFPLAFSAWLYLDQVSLKYMAIMTAFTGYIIFLVRAYLEPFIPLPGFNYEISQQFFNLSGYLAAVILFALAIAKIRKATSELALKENSFNDNIATTKALKSVLQSSNRSLYSANRKLIQQVNDHHRHLDTFLEALNFNIPLSITDAQGTILEVNEPFTAITQYSKEELVGNTHIILKSGSHPPAFFAEFWNTILSGKRWKGEIQNKAKDGSLYWVEIVVIGLKNDRQEIDKFISLMFPITEKKNSQASLEDYISSLESMAFITSHKLRKPVTNIKGLIDTLNDIELNEAEYAQIKDFLKESTVQLDNFTIELNDFIFHQIRSKEKRG